MQTTGYIARPWVLWEIHTFGNARYESFDLFERRSIRDDLYLSKKKVHRFMKSRERLIHSTRRKSYSIQSASRSGICVYGPNPKPITPTHFGSASFLIAAIFEETGAELHREEKRQHNSTEKKTSDMKPILLPSYSSEHEGDPTGATRRMVAARV